MKQTTKEVIGLDRLNRPVYPGDKIMDFEGKKYTVTERGACKSADGKEVKFSDLHGIELDGFISSLENITGPTVEASKPVEAKKPTLHAYDDPKLTGPVKKQPKERKPRKTGAGIVRNKLGLVRVSAVASEAVFHGRGATAALREASVNVIKRGPNNYVSTEDKDKALDVLRYKVTHPAVKVCCEAPAVEKLEQARVAVQKVAEAVELSGYTDQQLADELRRRGFEVTATKTVVVSL